MTRPRTNKRYTCPLKPCLNRTNPDQWPTNRVVVCGCIVNTLTCELLIRAGDRLEVGAIINERTQFLQLPQCSVKPPLGLAEPWLLQHLPCGRPTPPTSARMIGGIVLARYIKRSHETACGQKQGTNGAQCPIEFRRTRSSFCHSTKGRLGIDEKKQTRAKVRL